MRPTAARSAPWRPYSPALVGLVLCLLSCTNTDRQAVNASLADTTADPLLFYASHGPKTDPGDHAGLLDETPKDPAGIVRVVQGLLFAEGRTSKLPAAVSRSRIDREVNIDTVNGMLARIVELEDRPLVEPRPPARRMVAICAHYALLTTAIFRHHGIPARARGGFETYMSATAHHDHWIAEYWNGRRWVRVDAEIDGEFREEHRLDFDSLDLPPEVFLSGAEAWRRCREGEAAPSHFGIWGGEWYGGWDFVLNELLLDFNALNKVESLPWDEAPLNRRGYENLSAEERTALDEIAALVTSGDAGFPLLRERFKADPRLRK